MAVKSLGTPSSTVFHTVFSFSFVSCLVNSEQLQYVLPYVCRHRYIGSPGQTLCVDHLHVHD